MKTNTNQTEQRGLDTQGIYWREYDAAKKAYPKDGEECWVWHAEQAAGGGGLAATPLNCWPRLTLKPCPLFHMTAGQA